jgi:hypothetical protein
MASGTLMSFSQKREAEDMERLKAGVAAKPVAQLARADDGSLA